MNMKFMCVFLAAAVLASQATETAMPQGASPQEALYEESYTPVSGQDIEEGADNVFDMLLQIPENEKAKPAPKAVAKAPQQEALYEAEVSPIEEEPTEDSMDQVFDMMVQVDATDDGTMSVPSGAHGDDKFRGAATAFANGNAKQAANRWEAAAERYKAELLELKRQEVKARKDVKKKKKKKRLTSAELKKKLHVLEENKDGTSKKKVFHKKMPSSLMAEAAKLAAQRKSSEEKKKAVKAAELEEQLAKARWLFQSNKEKAQEEIELENENDIKKAKAEQKAKLPPGVWHKEKPAVQPPTLGQWKAMQEKKKHDHEVLAHQRRSLKRKLKSKLSKIKKQPEGAALAEAEDWLNRKTRQAAPKGTRIASSHVRNMIFGEDHEKMPTIKDVKKADAAKAIKKADAKTASGALPSTWRTSWLAKRHPMDDSHHSCHQEAMMLQNRAEITAMHCVTSAKRVYGQGQWANMIHTTRHQALHKCRAALLKARSAGKRKIASCFNKIQKGHVNRANWHTYKSEMNSLLANPRLSRYAGLSKKSAKKREQEVEVEQALHDWHI